MQVVILHNDGNGFGFGISGSRNSGPVVRNLFPGGAADRVSASQSVHRQGRPADGVQEMEKN